MPPQHRLFIAVDPPQQVIRRAAAIIERLRGSGLDAAWVNPAQLHVTLHFLGDAVDDADLHRICLAMNEAAAAAPPVHVAFGGVGVFPDMRRPRVVWLGVCDGEEGLVRLSTALAERLTPLGFPPDLRGSRPHLTLARIRGRGPRDGHGLVEAIDASRDAAAGEMTVQRIVLYESRRSQAGAEYDRLHTAPLTGR